MKTTVVGMGVPATAALIIYEFGNPELKQSISLFEFSGSL